MLDVGKIEKSVTEALALTAKNRLKDQPLVAFCRPEDASRVRLVLQGHAPDIPIQADIHVPPGHLYLIDPEKFTGRATASVLENQS